MSWAAFTSSFWIAFDVAYQADRANFSDVLDTERSLLDSQLEYFRALADFTEAIADLERAVGTELPAGTTTRAPSSEGQ